MKLISQEKRPVSTGFNFIQVSHLLNFENSLYAGEMRLRSAVFLPLLRRVKNAQMQGARRSEERGVLWAYVERRGTSATLQVGIFHPSFTFIKSFFFAVYTAAVFLPVEAGFPGISLPLRPALAEIPIVKLQVIFSGDLLSDLANQIVFLIPAVEECRRKGPDFFPVRHHGRSLESMSVTEGTAIPLALHQTSQEILQGVAFGYENLQTLACLIRPERVQSFLIFLVGMNIGVVEKTQGVDTLLTQDTCGIYRAGRTTDM